MILGIGIDSVEIARFERWKSFTQKQLARIFSQEEIIYSFALPNKTAERLAARFAAREALYKALSAAAPKAHIPFLTLCARTWVRNQGGRPLLKVDWEYCILAGLPIQEPRIHLSLTHTASVATACVIVEANAGWTRSS